MNDFHHILRLFGKQYPAAEPDDYIKLLYQNEFGCGHLAPKETAALVSLTEEWSGISAPMGVPLFEDIGNGLCRLNLSALSKGDLPLASQVFTLSAQTNRGADESFRNKLSLLTEAAYRGELPVNGGQMDAAVQTYLESGIRPTHHSKTYRKQYAPHYRVVEKPYALFFPALRGVEKLLQTGQKPVLAIDGRCASGKTTLAGIIERLFDCNVFHMDDFFLPFEMRSEARLAAPGGNVHYERFRSEVLLPLALGAPFCYRPFCCRDGSFGEPVSVSPKLLSIVEGAYSMHPTLREHYGGSVFLTVSSKAQQNRILTRNGAEMLRVFQECWIPLEERYFHELHIPDLCGEVIDTSLLDDN